MPSRMETAKMKNRTKENEDHARSACYGVLNKNRGDPLGPGFKSGVGARL